MMKPSARLATVILTLSLGLARAASAQTVALPTGAGGVAVVPPIVANEAILMAPGFETPLGALPTLSPALSGFGSPIIFEQPSLRTAFPLSLSPQGRTGLVIGQTAISAGPVLSAKVTPLKAPTTRGSLETFASAVSGTRNKPGSTEHSRSLFQSFFDATQAAAYNGADSPEGFRPPDWSEDRRINSALQTLSRSPVGRSIYQYAYDHYGSNLRIKVDDDRSASYDARMRMEGGLPALYLTESLLSRQSTEVIAAYLAREMSDLYYEGFPVSAERGFLSYGSMMQVYAELTDSDLARYGHWWDTGKDQLSDGVYVMRRYYQDWKEAVAAASRGGGVQDSAFFRFIQTTDDSNTEPEAKLSLRQLYAQGRITFEQYQQMEPYFRQVVQAEIDWVGNTGRW